MKYNFTKVKIADIAGNEIKEFKKGQAPYEVVANYLYNISKDLSLVETARQIYKGEEVELDKSEIAQIKIMIEAKECPLLSFAKKSVLDYIDSVKS